MNQKIPHAHEKKVLKHKSQKSKSKLITKK